MLPKTFNTFMRNFVKHFLNIIRYFTENAEFARSAIKKVLQEMFMNS